MYNKLRHGLFDWTSLNSDLPPQHISLKASSGCVLGLLCAWSLRLRFFNNSNLQIGRQNFLSSNLAQETWINLYCHPYHQLILSNCAVKAVAFEELCEIGSYWSIAILNCLNNWLPECRVSGDIKFKRY